MVTYLDTSFLFSLYAQDANTARAAQIVRKVPMPLAFTPLQRNELRNAFRLSLFRREITAAECQKLLETVETDTRHGVLVVTPVSWAEVYNEAEALSASHTGTLGTRGFDVLHIAAAIALGAGSFLTFDSRQKSLAIKAGLKFIP